MNRVKRISAAGFSFFLDTVFPPRSLITGDVASAHGIEAELWAHLSFLDAPCCVACGFPFDYDMGLDVLCGRCEIKRPAYDRARAAFKYDNDSRKLVLAFKHGGRQEGLAVFTKHVSRAGRALFAGCEGLIPIPLHPSRLRARRYNQSLILARAIAKANDLEVLPDIVQRVKATASQGGKSYSGRKRNVAGAFAVRASASQAVKGRNFILIDDVYTTGATLNACAKTLKRAGAARVDALTLSRVVNPQSVPT
ncbi:ComF family protein [Robiginitomaculum antarcticum]|uniref:ComF family protein n=1 Tax=Robiginitomaculum antarcticum TaxID=437507 RepID=UPI00037B40CC|nr:ComF family protein [Robiginitomaculum antarcticum]